MEDVLNISYLHLKYFSLNKNMLGKSVRRCDRGYYEYGIIVGFSKYKNLVYCHFSGDRHTTAIIKDELFIPIVDTEKVVF